MYKVSCCLLHLVEKSGTMEEPPGGHCLAEFTEKGGFDPMLSKRQNLLETLRGGKPDRYVNQFEAFAMVGNPFVATNPAPKPGQEMVTNLWGVTRSWPEGTPGPFPIHDAQHTVCKDITEWRNYVKAPSVEFSDEAWAPFVEAANQIDRSEYFVTVSMIPGIFEQCHYLMGMEDCLVNFYEEPEAMHELIDYLTEWELRYAEQLVKHLYPDAVFHHDDWGSQISTFLSPAMFEEFYAPAYKKLYGYYKANGVEVICHHSDSYAATLVPAMIDMGIDIWQGVMQSNNIPELIEKYGGKITFMGGIDSATVDFPGWTREIVNEKVREACEKFGTKFYIPNTSQGGAMSTFPGVYEAVTEEIDKMSKELFH